MKLLVVIGRAVGVLLVTVSLVAVAQTLREVGLFVAGEHRYSEESPSGPAVAFAGRIFAVTDNHPVTGTHSQTAYEGTIQPIVDGVPLGPKSRALVRTGLADLGRYHGWYGVWKFTDRRGPDGESLWLARRIQSQPTDAPRFEVTVVSPDGTMRTRLLHASELGYDYRYYRSTQFIRGTTAAIPWSVGEFAYFPILFLIFPIGTLTIGVMLLRLLRSEQSMPMRANHGVKTGGT